MDYIMNQSELDTRVEHVLDTIGCYLSDKDLGRLDEVTEADITDMLRLDLGNRVMDLDRYGVLAAAGSWYGAQHAGPSEDYWESIFNYAEDEMVARQRMGLQSIPRTILLLRSSICGPTLKCQDCKGTEAEIENHEILDRIDKEIESRFESRKFEIAARIMTEPPNIADEIMLMQGVLCQSLGVDIGTFLK
jgi:hypothetical protein